MLELSFFLENIKDLRACLIKILIFFFVCFLCNFFIVEKFIDYFTKPLIAIIQRSNAEIVYTNIVEPFSIRMHLAFIGGIFFSLPFILWEIYSFISPALYKREKKIILPYLFISPILFILGVLFVYYFIFPNAWNFFLKFAFVKKSNVDIHLLIVISDYLKLCITMMILFGLAFQLPVILNFLLQIRLISVETLKRSRKIVIVAIFIISAVLTPPDVLSQIFLAIPLIILYESSIFLSKFTCKS
jgi:sec-independent protein translocase protein TatC